MASPFNTTGGYGTPLSTLDGSVREAQATQLLGLILIELRTLNELIATGLNVEDETSSYRNDASLAAPTSLTNPS